MIISKRSPLTTWTSFPSLSDPRLPFVLILIAYVTLGVTFLGFNRTPMQVLLMTGAAMGLDAVLHHLFRRQDPPLFPLSAVITGLGLSILANFSHGFWLPLIPVFLAISSKYLLTYRGRHLFNPSLFGLAFSLLLFGGLISVSPPQQWGGSLAIVIFIVTAALSLFVFKIKRGILIVSFIAFYLIEIGLRAWILKDFIAPETLLLGSVTSPEFYLFTFFMLTDPATSPSTPKAQIGTAGVIVVIDAVLQFHSVLFSLFLAAFIYGCARLAWLHFSAWREKPGVRMEELRRWAYRAAVIACAAGLGLFAYRQLIEDGDRVKPEFRFTRISNEDAGIHYVGSPGKAFSQIDPHLASAASWLLPLGDAVATADVDGDGLQDIFLTNVLKGAEDRVALYLNKGDYRFERFAIPELTALFAEPADHGLPTGALFFDWNNDGAPDLVVLVSWGKTRFFENQSRKAGKLRFVDVTDEMQVDAGGNSYTANALDMTHSGKLDLVVGHFTDAWVQRGAERVPQNIFKPFLANENSEGGSAPKNMPNSYSDADNGGGLTVYRNIDGRFVKANEEKILGLREKRFALSIGTGDLNNDGWTDLYVANDVGPDHLLLSQKDGSFLPMQGRFTGDLGRDTYHGMNVSVGDLFNTGNQDIYVSNVHKPFSREGSILWVNDGIRTVSDVGKMNDRAWRMDLINKDAWGWGAAFGDLDRDGRLDVVQANGFISNKYSQSGQTQCPDQEESYRRHVEYMHHQFMGTVVNRDMLSRGDNWPDMGGECLFANEPLRVFLNRGRHFVEVANEAGMAELGEARGIALVDLQNQGKLDAIVTNQYGPVSIYKNEVKGANGWVGLQLEGNGRSCNRDAAGSRVTIQYTFDGKVVHQMREVQIVNGFAAQSDRRILFGLGRYSGDISATISWCGQAQQQVPLVRSVYTRVVQPPDF